MSTRLVPFLLAAALTYALGAGLSSLSHPAASAPNAYAGNAMPAQPAIPVLPTVVVHPGDAADASASAVTLPTVTVRPTEAEIAAAQSVDERSLGAGVVVVALRAFGGVTGLDMPYYSFGKSVYRLRKE